MQNSVSYQPHISFNLSLELSMPDLKLLRKGGEKLEDWEGSLMVEELSKSNSPMTGPTTESANSIALSCTGAKRKRRNVSNTISKDNIQALEKCKLWMNLKPEIIIAKNLYKNYEAVIQNTYNANIINDIIIGSNGRITAIFKDILIYDDTYERLKDFYCVKEAKKKISKMANQIKVLPNYFCIEERTFMLKNVKRKEKVKANKCKEADTKKEYNAITKGFMNELTKRASIIPPQVLAKMDMITVLDKFIDRDSLSLMENSNCPNIDLTITRTETKDAMKTIKAVKQKPNAKVKVRHLSQELIKETLQVKTGSNGRISAIGYYKARDESKSSLRKKANNKVHLVKSNKNLGSEVGSTLKGKLLSKERKNPKSNTRTSSYYTKNGIKLSNKAKATKNNKPLQTLLNACNVIFKKTPTVISMSNKELVSKCVVHKATGSNIKTSILKTSKPKKKPIIVVKKGFALGANTAKRIVNKQSPNFNFYRY